MVLGVRAEGRRWRPVPPPGSRRRAGGLSLLLRPTTAEAAFGFGAVPSVQKVTFLCHESRYDPKSPIALQRPARRGYLDDTGDCGGGYSGSDQGSRDYCKHGRRAIDPERDRLGMVATVTPLSRRHRLKSADTLAVPLPAGSGLPRSVADCYGTPSS